MPPEPTPRWRVGDLAFYILPRTSEREALHWPVHVVKVSAKRVSVRGENFTGTRHVHPSSLTERDSGAKP